LYNTGAVLCPLCRQRSARRSCPALGYQICAVCCGTKRLSEIRCPSECSYLATAREHPPAIAIRRQQHDLDTLVQLVRDFSERQTQLFFLIASFLVRYQPQELQPLIDADVTEAARALAATFETASRGVIYDHRPASLPAERLAVALKQVLQEAGKNAGSSFERDVAAVLGRMAETSAGDRMAASGPRAFVELLARMIRKGEDATREEGASGPPRLIVPS
jgi:hypothetical protein